MKLSETGLEISTSKKRSQQAAILPSKPSKNTKSGKILRQKHKKELHNRSGQAQNKPASDKLIDKKFYFMVA